jgi:hypothetical protein
LNIEQENKVIKKKLIHQSLVNIKYLKINLIQEMKDFINKIAITEVRNQRRHQKKEILSPFMNQQNQYGKNGHITKITLYISCTLRENSTHILHKDMKNNFLNSYGSTKRQNNQNNTEQKEQHWRHHNTCLQICYTIHSDKNSTVQP